MTEYECDTCEDKGIVNKTSRKFTSGNGVTVKTYWCPDCDQRRDAPNCPKGIKYYW